MIKLLKGICIRGTGYQAGDLYEGPEEAYMLRIGRGAPVAEVAEVAEVAAPVRRRKRRKAKAE